MKDPRRRSTDASRRGMTLTVFVALALFAGLGTLSTQVLGLAQGASTLPVTGNITGPSVLGISTTGQYVVRATGGPALASNGTIVGTYLYNATLSGTNTSTGNIFPPSGTLVNGMTNVTVAAPSLAQGMTLNIQVTSKYNGSSQQTNLSYSIQVVQPYILSITLLVGSGARILPFDLTVFLDGNPVGVMAIPSISANASYTGTFDYVTTGLSSGWHTFSVSLVQEHGLVTFTGGVETFSQSFYVTAPPPDNTIWYIAGTVAFLGAIFIFLTRVAARRRGRSKK